MKLTPRNSPGTEISATSDMTIERIHLSIPHMSGLERKYVEETFDSNWLSTVGPQLDAFEREMEAELGGSRHALAVSSGTAALHLVLRDLGVGTGDRVAVSTLTFAGSVYPILYQQARPVLIDSEAQSGNIDPDLVDEYLEDAARRGRLPKALIAVHLYGQHADIDRIAASCARFDVPLVEDAAESLGATYKGRPTGTTAPHAILSFNGNKIITTTGGGMALAQNPESQARMRKWANQSREPAVEYLHREVGHNYRMSNVLAAIGRGQLRSLSERVAQRQAVFARYVEGLSDIEGLSFQAQAPWTTHSRWLTVAFLDPAIVDRRVPEVVDILAKENIEARPFWRPMHTQPLFSDADSVGGAVAERLYASGICLPSSSSLRADQQERVITSLRSALTSAPSRSR